MARRLRRYRCKACKKTFNAATGTALQGLHKKGRWLTFGDCLANGLTVRKAAERCNFAASTSIRWRHRFLGTQDQNPLKLTGIVEVDETYVLESRKGIAILTERRAAGAAKPVSVACQTIRFRYYLPWTAAEQRLVLFFHLSRLTTYKAFSNPGSMMKSSWSPT